MPPVEGNDIDLQSARFVRRIGQPFTVGRKVSAERTDIAHQGVRRLTWCEGRHPELSRAVRSSGVILEHDVIAICRPSSGHDVALQLRDHLFAAQPVARANDNRIATDTVLVRYPTAVW